MLELEFGVFLTYITVFSIFDCINLGIIKNNPDFQIVRAIKKYIIYMFHMLRITFIVKYISF